MKASSSFHSVPRESFQRKPPDDSRQSRAVYWRLFVAKMTKEEIEKVFRKFGIDYSQPGFYDTTEFKAVEKRNPTFLMSYAEYIEALEFSPKYLARARQCTTEAATFIFGELLKDGRKGACIDASGTLQRILEKKEYGIIFQMEGYGFNFHKSHANEPYANDFTKWIESRGRKKNTILGEPQLKDKILSMTEEECRSFCSKQHREEDELDGVCC
jgi:hypothetical protein